MAHHLDVKDEIGFQKKEWVIEKIGWFFLTLFLIAGALGFFGNGHFASGQSQNGDLRIEFDRYARNGSHSRLSVFLEKSPAGQIKLWVPSQFLQDIELNKIIPQPDRTEFSQEGVVYIFNSSLDDSSRVAIFDYTTKKLGSLSSTIRHLGHHSVEFKQFVYP